MKLLASSMNLSLVTEAGLGCCGSLSSTRKWVCGAESREQRVEGSLEGGKMVKYRVDFETIERHQCAYALIEMI